MTHFIFSVDLRLVFFFFNIEDTIVIKNMFQQECIPVGCEPSAAVAELHVSTQGGGLPTEGGLPLGGSAYGGGFALTPPPRGGQNGIRF